MPFAGNEALNGELPERGQEDEAIENAADVSPQAPDRSNVRALTTPPTIHLKTMHDVRLEMAKIYREVRRGKLNPQDGSKMTFMLSSIGKVIESSVLDVRAEAIERVLRMRKIDN